MKHHFLMIYLLILITGFSCTGSQTRVMETVEMEEELGEKDITVTHEEVEMFIPDPNETLPVHTFREVWGYVIAGQEAALRRGLPITDVGYFGAEIDMYGVLSKVPDRRALTNFSGRVHLTVTCFNYPLSYFALLPGSPQRQRLIDDLISATANFDGLNIDFENVPPRSGEAFLSFLKELKQGLPDKILSVALYARHRRIRNDVYDYENIAPIVDKIFVMAYDEHWGGGPAGPVASLRFSRSVALYSLRAVGADKLVMGIPLYGRAWANANHHRALIHSTTQRLINTYNAQVRRENGIPTFDYNATVSVKVYFEDEYSISARIELYRSMGVTSIGFWRIGQETPRIWNFIRIEE